MTVITELGNCKTLSEVKQIERKYYDILPDNQKWELLNWCHHASMRITRVEQEKKLSWANKLN
jgi:hypothetical protein